MFSHIIGNEQMKSYLQKAIEKNCLAQTLLFIGPDGIGKSLFAKAIAKTLLASNHSPDLHIYAPEGKSGLYAIDTLRELIEQEHSAPFESKGKVFILEDAARMQPASANALLKTLEEPTPETTFILLTSHPSGMLPTILSRCSQLHFQPLTTEEIAHLLRERGHPIHFAKWASGSFGKALEFAATPEFEEQRGALFKLLRAPPSYPELALKLTELEKKLEGEEDPVKWARRVDDLFAAIFMWHRDQHVRDVGAKEELLYFPDEPKCPAVSLKEIEWKIHQARLGIERNLKLSACLTYLFS